MARQRPCFSAATYSDGEGGVKVADGVGGTSLGGGHLAALAASGLAGEESGLNSETGAQPGGTLGRGFGEGSQSGEHVDWYSVRDDV